MDINSTVDGGGGAPARAAAQTGPAAAGCRAPSAPASAPATGLASLPASAPAPPATAAGCAPASPPAAADNDFFTSFCSHSFVDKQQCPAGRWMSIYSSCCMAQCTEMFLQQWRNSCCNRGKLKTAMHSRLPSKPTRDRTMQVAGSMIQCQAPAVAGPDSGGDRPHAQLPHCQPRLGHLPPVSAQQQEIYHHSPWPRVQDIGDRLQHRGMPAGYAQQK